jgi:hypothetical protein
MVSIAQWFGAEPFHYYVIALAALFIFVALAIVPRNEIRDSSAFERAFLVMIGLVLYAWRWPVFFVPYALNPDEGIWVAGALKATVDPLPWRGFDSESSGPLSSNVLALPAIFGTHIDFFSARIIGVGLMIGTMCALYYALKWTYGAHVGRLAVFPPVVFLSLTIERDFIHFSSEHLPIFLIAVALAACIFLFNGHGSVSSRLTAAAAAGLSIGSVALAKLQALPIAVTLFALVAVAILSVHYRLPDESGVIAITALALLCFVPLVILLTLWLTGELNDAIISYIRMALVYIPYSPTYIGWRFFFRLSKLYTTFLEYSLAVILIGSITMIGRCFSWRAIYASAASALVLLSSLYAIYQPHRYYAHYLLFSIVPLSYCVGNAMGLTRDAGFWKGREMLISLSYAALFLVPALSVAMAYPNPFVADLTYNSTHATSEPAKAIARYAAPGSRIVIWGWMPEYYVQTGTVMATRDAQTGPQIVPGPYQDYFRQRFMSDIRTHAPSVFVDAVAPDSYRFTERAAQGHEIFPALATFISEHYVLKEEVAGVRIYTAKDL